MEWQAMVNIEETSARSIEAINFFMETSMKITLSLFFCVARTRKMFSVALKNLFSWFHDSMSVEVRVIAPTDFDERL